MSKYTAFRCPEELLEKAKAKAQRDRRSLSNYLIMLIEKDVKPGRARSAAVSRRPTGRRKGGAKASSISETRPS